MRHEVGERTIPKCLHLGAAHYRKDMQPMYSVAHRDLVAGSGAFPTRTAGAGLAGSSVAVCDVVFDKRCREGNLLVRRDSEDHPFRDRCVPVQTAAKATARGHRHPERPVRLAGCRHRRHRCCCSRPAPRVATHFSRDWHERDAGNQRKWSPWRRELRRFFCCGLLAPTQK